MQPPPKRWVAGTDAVEAILAKGHQLIADATAFSELSNSLGRHDSLANESPRRDAWLKSPGRQPDTESKTLDGSA